MTDRSFGGDWWLHLRLLDQQRIAWETLGHPTLFTSMDPVGALTPLPMLFGATLNAMAGFVAASGIGTLPAYVLLHVSVTWAAFFGMWWLSGLLGLPSWWRYVPSVALVTSAFFLGDPLGRGGVGQFAATQILPLTAAGVADAIVNRRVRLRSALAILVTVPVALGGHTISAIWTLLLGLLLLLSLRLIAPQVLSGLPRRTTGLLALLFAAGAAATAWAMIPAALLARQLNTNIDSFDFDATRYFGNPAIWLSPVRIIPGEHVEFWRAAAESGGLTFQGATSLFVQIPVLFLLWSLIILIRNRREQACRSAVLMALSLLPAGLLLAALMTFPELWTAVPEQLRVTQYGFRLMSYAQILVAALLALAIKAYLCSPARGQAPLRSPGRAGTLLILAAIVCAGQAVWQGWNTVNITNHRGYDQPRQEALVTPFEAVDWYDATQARAAGDPEDSTFWTQASGNNFTPSGFTQWRPADPVQINRTLLTPVVAPDGLVEWQDAVPITRTPSGFVVVKVTGPDVVALVSPPWWVVVPRLISLAGLAGGLVLVGFAFREGRRGPNRVVTDWQSAGRATGTLRKPAALACLAAGALSVAALVPSQSVSESYQWRLSAGPPVDFVSATGIPSETRISVPCSSFAFLAPNQATVLARTAPPALPGIVLIGQQGRVSVGIQGRAETFLSSDVTPRDCTVEAIYTAPDRLLTLDAGNGRLTTEMPVDVLSGNSVSPVLAAPSGDALPATAVELSVETSPTVITSGPLRSMAIVVAVICGLLLLLWSRLRFSSPTQVLAGPAFTRLDAVVGVVLLAGVFLIPPGFDDGWVLTTVRAFDSLGHFSNFFTGSGAVQPQGAWWNALQATYSNALGIQPSSLLRLPEALFSLLAWVLLRRLIHGAYPHASRTARVLGATLFVTGALAFLSGIRPESVVVLLLVSLMISLTAYRRTGALYYFALSWLLVGLAVAAHQSGLALLTTAAASIPTLIAHWRFHRRDMLGSLLAVSPALIITAAVVLLPGTPGQLWEGLTAFQASSEYQKQFYELARWLEVLDSGNNGINAVRRVVPVIGVLVMIAAWLVWRDLSSRARWLLVLCTLPWAGLVLTASKWAWHFGVIVPTCAAMVLLAADAWRLRLAGRVLMQVSLLGFLALVGFNVSQGSQDWTQGFDAPLPIAGPAPFVGPLSLDSAFLWFLLFLVSAFLVWRRPQGTALLASVCAGVTLVLVVSLLPVVQDGLTRPGSWLSQQANVQGRCGLAAMPIALRSAALPQFGGDPLSAQTMPVQNLALPLLPDDTTAYMSSSVTDAATPWFVTKGGEELTGLITTTGSGVTARLEFNDAFGGRVTRVPLSRQGNDVWFRWNANTPADAQYVRVRWSSAGEQVTATEPLAVKQKGRVADVAAGARVWNNPQAYFQAACFEPIDISTGGIPALDVAFGLPQWAGNAWTKVNRPVELACPGRQDPLAVNVCAYGFTGRPLTPPAEAT